MEEIDPEEGDFFEGVLLETFRDGVVSRPRVRPVAVLPRWLKVEFPRHLRESNPIKTRFRADVHVRRKHYGDGTPKGPLYLRADNHSIFRVKLPDAETLIFAKQRPGTISGRAYEYFSISARPKSAAEAFTLLRRKAYESIVESAPLRLSEAMRRERSRLMAEYALARSNGVCEGCLSPAPFLRRNGEPYLEVHHIVSMAAQGADHPANVAAICPNCHARITHGKDGADLNSNIKARIVQLEARLDQAHPL